jgi:hypothetical protein
MPEAELESPPPETAPESSPESPSPVFASADAATVANVASEMEPSPAAGDHEEQEHEDQEPVTEPQPATGARDDQMAAIRQMLADLKENAEEESEPEPELEEDPAPVVEPAPPRHDDDEFERDTLKSRIDGANKRSRAIKGEASDSGYNSAKLRRQHEKRAKKLQRARDRRRNKSGAFLTGFTLVSVVSATLVGLYVLQPQIVDVSPKMGPALNEYVVTVDRYRVQLNDATAEWRKWLTERIGKLRDQEG